MLECTLRTAIALIGITLGTTLLSGCKGIVDDQAEQALLASLGDTSVTVFPAFVREGKDHRYDAAAAASIGQFLTDEGLASVTLANQEVPITGSWRMNQAKMLRESAADFAVYIKAHPAETEYVLLPEYLIGGSGAVGGIHCYVLDKDTRVAFGVLLNSHWDVFADANPKTVEDCTDVLTAVLAERLEPVNGE